MVARRAHNPKVAGSSPAPATHKAANRLPFLFPVMNPLVYILYSEKLEKFYIGETDNLEKRLIWHNDPNLNTNFSRKGIPWTLFYTISCDSRTQARKIETHIKSMKSKKYIYNLKKYPEISLKLLQKYR